MPSPSQLEQHSLVTEGGCGRSWMRLLDTLNLVYEIREAQRRGQSETLLWPWSSTTAFRQVRKVMAVRQRPRRAERVSKRPGARLRMQAASRRVALNINQKWLRHTQLLTIAVYADAVDEEEKFIAATL